MKLTIELVPRTAWFKNLRNHVGAAKWNKIRKELLFSSVLKYINLSITSEKTPTSCEVLSGE